MPTPRVIRLSRRCSFAIATVLLIGFLETTVSYAQSAASTNSPYAPGQPPPGVVDIAKWQEQQRQNPPTPYTQPTVQQTYNTLDSYSATRNLDPWTKNEIATNTPMGRSFISGAYLTNGQPNPFYANGQTEPNWFVPATWTQPYQNWQGVLPNGASPSASATTHSTTFSTPVYNPTSNASPYTSRPYQPPTAQSQSAANFSRDNARASNLDPMRAQTGLTSPGSGPERTINANALAKLTSDRETALAVSATAGDKLGQAANHIGLAQLLVEQGNFRQALVHINAAEPMVATAPDLKLRVDLLRAKSAAHMQSGEFEESLADNRTLMPILRTLADEGGQAETFLSSAWAFQSVGDIQKAINCYDSAFRVFSNIGDKEGQVRARIGLGSLYLSLSQYDKAHAEYKAALPLASDRQKARIYASNANLLQAVGDPFSAVAHYKEAQRLLGSGADSSLEIAILTGMGRSLMALYNFRDSEKSFAQALRLVSATQNTSSKAAIVASMGELQYWMAISPSPWGPSYHFKEALKNYDIALPLMRAIGDRAGEIGVLTNTGLVYDAQGKSKQALAYYSQALERMEQLQTQARLEEFRGNIADQSAALYARAVQLAVETHQQEKAFALSESARARLFLDQLGNVRVDDIRQAPAEFLSREAQLRKENIALERQLGQELSRPGGELNSESMTILQSNLAAVRASYETLMNNLKLSNPSYAAFLNVSPISLLEAQRSLDPSSMVVSFYTEPDETFAFIVTKTSLTIKKLEVGQAELTHEVATFRDFAEESEISPSLRILYKALIAPIHAELKTSRLILVPHGVLHDLPFGALTPDGHRFLSDEFSISYLPSVSALSYMHAKASSPAPRALVLVSDQEEGFPQLHSANDEGRSVAAFFESSPLVGKEATASVLRSEASNYDVLHLAAHFEINRKNPMASQILLSRGEKDDGSPLDLLSVYGLHLAKTNLVVLSGCESQSGKRTRGDDIIGLSQAFLYAGSSSVIASLWKVDDEATKLLMVAFYTHLRDGLSKADALRAAQAEVRQKYPSPFYWAGFVLNGDPGTLTRTTTAAAAN